MSNEKVKAYFWIVFTLFLVGILVNLVFFVMPTIRAYRNSLAPVRTISVSAEGKTTATPDLAEFSFSVVSEGNNPDSITGDNNRKVFAAVALVKERGIDTKDIKTTQYNLSPRYEYNPKNQKSFISGYTVTQTVTVKVRQDFAKVAKILGGLPTLGINQIGGVTFTVDDPEIFLAQARAEAFAKAKVKAQQMVAAGGVKLGRVVNISESGGGPIFFNSVGNASYQRALAGAPVPAIEPGSQEVKTQVTLTYELR